MSETQQPKIELVDMHPVGNGQCLLVSGEGTNRAMTPTSWSTLSRT